MTTFAQKARVKTYWVYMLRCSDGSFYVGVTNNLEYRVAQHETGFDRKCYTFKRRPVKLVHSSEFYEITDAICWEKQLKGWSRAKKEALVRSDWPSIVRLARNYGERFGHPSTSSG
jgi:putative endonuclease